MRKRESETEIERERKGRERRTEREREKERERERKGRHRKRETHREQKRFSIPCIRYECEIFHIVVNRIAIMTFIFASHVFIGFEIIYQLMLINSSF